MKQAHEIATPVGARRVLKFRDVGLDGLDALLHVVLAAAFLMSVGAVFAPPLAEAQLAEGHYVVLDPPIVYPGAVVRFSASAPDGVRTGLVRVGDREFGGELEEGVLTIYFAMDMDTVAGPHRLEYELGDRRGALTVTVRARKFETEYLGIEPHTLPLSEDDLDRAETDRAQLDRVLVNVIEERLWRSSFVLPLDGELGAPFGLRRVFDGQRHSPHSGLDITAEAGTSVRATNYGKVAVAGVQLFSGKVIVLDHGRGLISVYAHLAEIFVRPGQHVASDEVIGQVGQSGRATQPHLHFAIRLMGARVDPISLPGIEFGAMLQEIENRDAELRRCDIDGACDEAGNPIIDPETLGHGHGHGDGGADADADADAGAVGGVPPGEEPREEPKPPAKRSASPRFHAYE
ncbi:MAG: murein DD-endopeptidase MepM/ murein hydrolase activator NlpD [Candidatus Binatia bacterium]|jgi:murein DD-endopeptidase MepM/ murein hydrolase activator NlpD